MTTTKGNPLLEACVESLAAAIRAEQNGADRIELCDSLHAGGLTPQAELLQACKKKLSIPVFVMVRPRPGNFVFSSAEQEEMAASIPMLRLLGADGIVTGALLADGTVDTLLLKQLVEWAHPLPLTFHKAIDETTNLEAGALAVASCGAARLLTSGGCLTALEGSDRINRLIEVTRNKLIVVAAGRITASNFSVVKASIGAEEFHGKNIVGDLNEK